MTEKDLKSLILDTYEKLINKLYLPVRRCGEERKDEVLSPFTAAKALAYIYSYCKSTVYMFLQGPWRNIYTSQGIYSLFDAATTKSLKV